MRRSETSIRTSDDSPLSLFASSVRELEHRARETTACDYFIDALDDPNFALSAALALGSRPTQQHEPVARHITSISCLLWGPDNSIVF